MTRIFGKETRDRLIDWDHGQGHSETLCAQIMIAEGFGNVDPQHPFGGPDGGKDALAKKDNLTFTGGFYFARGKKTFSPVKKKFREDLASANKLADAFVFVTNQEVTVGERKILTDFSPDKPVEIIHLHRLTSILNSPINYGVRQEYLQIDMTREELVAFVEQLESQHLSRLDEVNSKTDAAILKIEEATRRIEGFATGGDSFPFFSIIETSGSYQLMVRAEGDFPIFDLSATAWFLDNSAINTICNGKWQNDLWNTNSKPSVSGKRDVAMNKNGAKGIGRISDMANRSFPSAFRVSTFCRNGMFDHFMVFDQLESGQIRCSASLVLKGVKVLNHWVFDPNNKDSFKEYYRYMMGKNH